MAKHKISIQSKAAEKAIDAAKEFVSKIISPAATELGLLAKDTISYWRLKNQVTILEKSRKLCESQGVKIKPIQPKLLVPFIDQAALEDDNEMQNTWAQLLANLVDSRLNITNHVFPYILGQLSKDEYLGLSEQHAKGFKSRGEAMNELREYLETRDAQKAEIEGRLKKAKSSISKGKKPKSISSNIDDSMRFHKIRHELWRLEWRERVLREAASSPMQFDTDLMQAFEVANISRLGLIVTKYSVVSDTHRIDIPHPRHSEEETSVDFDLELETEESAVITELGELFIQACQPTNSD